MSIALECVGRLDRGVVLRGTLMKPLPIGEGNGGNYFAGYFGFPPRIVPRAIADTDAADA
jgi:hypothetical protein